MRLWATWPSWRCPCSLQRGWTKWPLKVPSKPNYSMILWDNDRFDWNIVWFYSINIRKYFFITVRVIEHWHRLPRKVAESQSLEIFKSHLAMVLGNQLNVVLREQEFWARWPPQVSSNFCDSVFLAHIWILGHVYCIGQSFFFFSKADRLCLLRFILLFSGSVNYLRCERSVPDTTYWRQNCIDSTL